MQHRWIVSVVAAAVMAANAYAHPVQVQVTPIGSMATAAQDVKVKVTYINTGNIPYHIANYAAQLDGRELRDELFNVYRDGQRVQYVGAFAKRPPLTAANSVTIAPGKSYSTIVNLSTVYAMDKSGNYSFEYAAPAQHVVLEPVPGVRADKEVAQGGPVVEGPVTEMLQSNSAGLFVEGRNNQLMERAQSANLIAHMSEGIQAASVTYTSCSSTRQSQIATAVPNGATYATNAYNYLTNTTPSGTARFTTWFGKYSSADWTKVTSHYNNIKSTLSSKALNFNCSCTESDTYAYVYPDQPYKYYLCGAFWSAPATGTDSKAGTLVHESSHFTVNGGTQDYQYGQTAAKSLAKSNPAEAIMNADSHEYFAENNPAQN